MFEEIDLGGVFIAPIFGYLVLSGIIFIPISWIFDRWQIQRWVANRPVFDACMFILLFGLVVIAFQFL